MNVSDYLKSKERKTPPDFLTRLFDRGCNYFTIIPKCQIAELKQKKYLKDEYGLFIHPDSQNDIVIGYAMINSLKNLEIDDFLKYFSFAIINPQMQKEYLRGFSSMYYKTVSDKLGAIEREILQNSLGKYESFVSPGENLEPEQSKEMIVNQLNDYMVSAILINSESEKYDLDQGSYCYMHRDEGTGPIKSIRYILTVKPKKDNPGLTQRSLNQLNFTKTKW